MSTTTKLTKREYTHYGLPIYELPDGTEWAVGTAAQAQKAARLYCRRSLWTFNAAFILNWITDSGGRNGTEPESKAIQKMQVEMCENCNEIIAAMLGRNLKAMIEDAIATDGRGHYLAQYDSAERKGESVHPKFKGKLAYRIN